MYGEMPEWSNGQSWKDCVPEMAPRVRISLSPPTMKILFICKSNAFRSQMAMAIYNKLTESNDAYSAGTYVGAPKEPEGALITTRFQKPDFFEFMEEKGMDIRKNITKGLIPNMLDEADVVVSMAQEPFVPDFLKNHPKVIFWDVEDPKSVDRKVVEETYEKIEKLVRGLL
jgi:protein-tyrosine-phosphatase